MFTKTTIVSLVASLAAAAPTTEKRQVANPENFVAITTRSGDENVHLRGISGYDQHFYINLDASGASCPNVPDISCADFGNNTIFGGNPSMTTLSLDVAVPGGQQVYVEASGALAYTVPHSSNIPQGGLTGPFEYTPQPAPGTVGTLQFENNDWFACPATVAGESVYQIYAGAVMSGDNSACIGVGVATASFNSSAPWQLNF